MSASARAYVPAHFPCPAPSPTSTPTPSSDSAPTPAPASAPAPGSATSPPFHSSDDIRPTVTLLFGDIGLHLFSF